jgi:ribosomal protein L40E
LKSIHKKIGIPLLLVGIVVVMISVVNIITYAGMNVVPEYGHTYSISYSRPGVLPLIVGAIILAVGIATLVIGSWFTKRGAARAMKNGLGKPSVAVCVLCGTENAANAMTCSSCGSHKLTVKAQ